MQESQSEYIRKEFIKARVAVDGSGWAGNRDKEEQKEEREAHRTSAQHKANPLPTPKARSTWHPVSA